MGFRGVYGIDTIKMGKEKVPLTDQVLTACWETLVILHVVEKLLDISTEAVHRWIRSDEAEGLHGAVVSNPQHPLLAIHSHRASGRAQRLNSAKSAKPNKSHASAT